MAGSKGARPEFSRLWPTVLMRHSLPGAEAANPLLIEIIEKLDSASDDMTANYLSGDFMVYDHPVVAWLRDCFNRAVVDYARHAGIDYRMDWHLQAWPNVNRFGDYHNLHNHPHSWLSGTYYVQVPTDRAEREGRSDLDPGAISFFDPRPQANMLAVRGDPQVDPEHRIMPEPGLLLLWPAFLHHLVHPNLSRQKRISISFNVVLKWRDEYVP